VQFAQGVHDSRAYAIKFFLDEESFYAEAALYVAVFPHLKQWLSRRATDALTRIAALPGCEVVGESEVANTMQAAASRFLPQVLPYLKARSPPVRDPSEAIPCIVCYRVRRGK
jgi:hypothetical protein